MENNVYNDEKILDDQTAQQLAVAYSAMLTALDAKKNIEPYKISFTELSTNQLLEQILFEIRAIRKELELRKRIRLEF